MTASLKRNLFFGLLCLLFSQALAHEGNKTERQTAVKFTQNKNQWEKEVLFRAQLDGGALFLQKNAFTYHFYDKDALRAGHYGKANLSKGIKSHAFRVSFLSSLPSVETSSKQITPDYCNYFIGNDKKKWAGNVKNYREVNYKSLYEGIDLQVLGMENSIKYNFFVAPLADASAIQMFYEGLDQLTLEKGALHLKTSINEMTEQRPYAYQWIKGKRVDVPCEFELKNNKVSFVFPRGYDKGYELVIDPILIFACSSGSIADNFGMTATYDAEGNLYSGGTVFGIGFPTTVGAFDTSWNGSATYLYGRTDVVITKYDSSGTFLQYSTYLGGTNSTEIVTSLVVNASNELFLYGATGSNDFPTTATAYDQTYNGGILLRFVYNGSYFDNGTDIYVSRFNSAGTALLASTYIGGSLNDGVNVNNDSVFFPPVGAYEFPADSLQYNYGDQYRGEINLDLSGNVYISSSSRSGNFPIVNGFDNAMGGEQDAVVFKFNPDLSTLVWSTYLGGTDNDAGYALALDDSANVYVTGGTRSLNFPITAGALQTVYAGGKTDGYVVKIKNDGSGILFSTLWGTPAYDQSYFVQLDKGGDVYIVGQTEGAMPVTTGVYNNPGSAQFITKMNDSLNTLIFSTVFGNGSAIPHISPSAFLVDYCENIYVSGWGGKIVLPTITTTTGMPLTPDAIQPTTDGHNFYLIVLSTDAASLLYATYFGGGISWEHVDGGTSRFDKKGIIYQSVCAGCQTSASPMANDDFPVTPGSWPGTGADVNHNTQNNNCNNGTFKFDFQIPIADANFTVDYISGCAPLTVQFDNQSSPGSTYLWDFGGGDTTSAVVNPIRTFPTPGSYLVQLYVFNPTSCNMWDTAYQYVTVHAPITADFDFTSVPCSNQVSFVDSSSVGPVSWQWDFDDGNSSTVQNPSHTYASSGSYDVTLISTNSNGCKDTTVVEVNLVNVTVSVNPGVLICEGSSAQLLASGGFAYSWSPATGLNNTTIANPVATPDSTTNYTVIISTVNALGDTCYVSLSTTVSVFIPGTIGLTATADNDTIFSGSSTVLHAITDTSLTILWTPASGVSNTGSFNPTVSPTTTTTYTVTIVDSSGCPKYATITIYVISEKCNPADVFVPNTFTPNNDGENDILYVRGNMITEMYFAVYNRWGELVFETTKQSVGWDGIYKGMKVDPAVFAWYLTAKCYNGEELKKQGNTTVLR